MRPYRRRHYLIHSLQYRLLTAVMVYFLAAITGVIGVVFGPLILDFSSGPAYSMEKYEAAGVFLRLHQQFWPVVLLLLVAIVLHSVLLTHRIGGPLYRFRSIFQSVGRGDLSMRVRLRRHDYAKAEAEELDQMIASLRERVETAQSDCRQLVAAAVALHGIGPDWQQFQRRLDALQQTLDGFHVGPASAEAPREAPAGRYASEVALPDRDI